MVSKSKQDSTSKVKTTKYYKTSRSFERFV